MLNIWVLYAHPSFIAFKRCCFPTLHLSKGCHLLFFILGVVTAFVCRPSAKWLWAYSANSFFLVCFMCCYCYRELFFMTLRMKIVNSSYRAENRPLKARKYNIILPTKQTYILQELHSLLRCSLSNRPTVARLSQRFGNIKLHSQLWEQRALSGNGLVI